MFATKRVFVTGIGVVSSVGLGKTAFWESLCAGQDGRAPVELFDTSEMNRHVACEIKDFPRREFLSAAEQRHAGRCSSFALAAARMAFEDAGLAPDALAHERTAVVVGTTMGEADVLGELEAAWLHEGSEAVNISQIPRYGTTLLPIHVARAFGTRGIVQSLPAACAAGNYAIGFASDQIRLGRADVAITGASEIIEKLQYAGFVRLGAMAPERCQPFDKNRKGLLLGEGAAMMILESEEHMRARGAEPQAEIGGYGLACDAHHITRPHPEGEGSLRAMTSAIASSGLAPKDIDFINAHGTGTSANDPIEASVIQRCFEKRPVPITSIKSMLGHCMGAASAIEAVSCVLTLEHNRIPPTIHLEDVDPECDLNIVRENHETAAAVREGKSNSEIRYVLNNALAFGGYDAVLCIAKPGALPEPEPAWKHSQ